MELTQLFCIIDDFCLEFEPQWNRMKLQSGLRERERASLMSLSEVMTIIIWFHQSKYRTFKGFYQDFVLKYHHRDFPCLVSYNRFVELMAGAFLPLSCFFNTRKGTMVGIGFIDATSVAVCHNRRIRSHKVFEGLAKRGKTSVDWFYGFKLHLVINDEGEILALKITPGNVDDRAPVREMTHGLFGKLFGDRGYISQPLFLELFERGLQLITRVKKTKKKVCHALMPVFDKLMLRKRAIIESVNDQLKNISQIEHTRHRSPINFMVNLIAGLIAYTLQPKKPSLGIRPEIFGNLPTVVF